MSQESEGTLSGHIEVEIAKLLKPTARPVDIASTVVQWLQQPHLNFAEQSALLIFLYNAGFFKALAQQFQDFLERGKPIPWHLLTELCGHPAFAYHNQIGELLLLGATETKQKPLALRSFRLDTIDSRFPRERLIIQNDLEAEFNENQNQLIERIAFFREQRLVQQEREAALRLYQLNPKNREGKQALDDVEGRWAREIIERRPVRPLDSFGQDRLVSRYNQDDEAAIAHLLEAIQATAQQSPELIYDLSILLYFVELKQEALNLLRTASPSAPVNWFRLELLIETRHFVETLDLVQQLEIEYCNDPETLFATTYARARALKELGKKAVAIDLLQSIVNIKPHYRSAHSLLTQWIEE